jgi:PAS domain S-box-containing protein
MQDAAGTHFIGATQAAPMVASAANAPVFAMDDVDVGRGTVGGAVQSFDRAGQLVAGMAVRILQGEKPQDIPIARGANAYIFDWRALRRFGLKESNLPLGSAILNREPSFWEIYSRYLLAGILLFLAQALIIVALLWQRARRRKVEAALARSRDQLRLAMDAGKSVGWELDVKSGRDTWFGDLQSMFGISSDTFTGHLGDFYRYVHPEDRQRVAEAVSTSRQNREPYVAEFRIVWSDGTTRWVASRGEHEFAANGEAKRMFGMAVDITQSKQAEASLRESEARFRLVANTAPVMIWMSGPDRLCTYFNQPWLEFTGRSFEAELGNGWAEGIHQDDLERCLDTYTRAFDQREPFQMEYRLQRRDREYRWILDLGVPRLGADGSFAGYIGSCLDVTERKLAEEALSSVSRRLIEAH